MADRVVLLSIPQLRHKDVSPGGLASLEALSAKGGIAELVPPFPGLAASSFATLVTGTGPYGHGLIGNVYFDRAERKIVPGPLPDSAVQAPRLWEQLRAARPGAKTLLWFAPNSRGAAVDYAAWVDHRGELATEPSGLSEGLLKSFGPLPKSQVVGEPPRLETTAWLLKTAAATIAAERPDLSIVRVPYLGQIARRHGPDGREAGRAIRELEPVLARFFKALPPSTLILAVTESVTTPASNPIYPNRVLRSLGLLALTSSAGKPDIDLDRSAAFAVADHQIAHLYINDPNQAATIASAFSGPHGDGIATVAPGNRRAMLGLDHARAGDVVLVACPDRWFASDWWRDPSEVPPNGGVLGKSPDASQVKGSLGAPPPGPSYLGVIVASQPDVLKLLPQISAKDVAGLILSSWNATK